MEETKLNTPLTSQKYDDLEVAQWQWQSDLNPYQETDPSKWTWQDYSDDENLILEEVYSYDREAVLLKDYEVDLKKRVQICLQDNNKTQRVRRQEPSRLLMEIPEAKALVVKDQKTMNEAFGTVQHFLEYIMKRTPEVYVLYRRLKTLSLDSNRSEFEDLIQQVLASIERAAEVRARIIGTRTGPTPSPKYALLQARKIRNIIEEKSSTLRDFLKAILKSSTMGTSICYWLNELLRSEDWEEINVLSPYLVCLLYTSNLPDYTLKPQIPQNRLGFVVKHKLHLYRGAALTEDQLVSYYNPNKVEHFSWNAVASMTRDRNIALDFMNLSFHKAGLIKVLFLIDIDFDSSEDHHGVIDLSKDSLEQEVILAPGTVFKLLEISLIENDIYEIHLKITKSPQETQDHVALQNQAISKQKATIGGLPSEASFNTLKLLRDNKLIRRLDIRNSGIEESIMEEIESIRVTTNVRKEDVKLFNNTVVVSNLSVLVHYFSRSNLNEILKFNKVRFGPQASMNSKEEEEIPRLILKDETIQMFRKYGQLKEFWKRLKSERQIRGLELSIQKIQLQEDEIVDFLECIKEWEYLEDLALELNDESSMEKLSLLSSKALQKLSLRLPFSDKALNLVQTTSESLKCLKILTFDCPKFGISDEELRRLERTLNCCASLIHLSLNFRGCDMISDKGLNHLENTLTALTSLQHLSLYFESCQDISDKGLRSLKDALTSLTSLQHLSLDFSICPKISNEGLKHLKNSLVSLTSLQHLSLNLESCNQISNEGLNQLENALTSLTSLQHLSLNFAACKQLSDEGLNSLKDALISLTFLKLLSLNFRGCDMISEKGLKHLKSSLISLTSLQHLSLDFSSCNKITNEGLNQLVSLTSLQHLFLNLGGCSQISDKGLNYLKNSLISLTSLQHLSLDFLYCNKISDEGLHHLKGGLAALTSLQHIFLNFRGCEMVSDKGLDHLRSSLISMISLQHLSLNFNWCKKISDKGLSHLKSSIISLTSLQHLSLDFSVCDQISDEGLNSLKSGLIYLTSLQHLSLDFRACMKISEKGLNHLKSSLKSLTSLQKLSLDFSYCQTTPDERLNHFLNEFKSIPNLDCKI